MDQTEEQAIRDLIATWMNATATSDLQRLLPLMTEDVVFLTPGQPAMRGRDAFATAFQGVRQHVHIEPVSDIQEIQIMGDWAYCWNHLSVTVTAHDTKTATRRTGYALSILRKQANGAWVIVRDASLLTSANPT